MGRVKLLKYAMNVNIHTNKRLELLYYLVGVALKIEEGANFGDRLVEVEIEKFYKLRG